MGINARGLYSVATDAEDPIYAKGNWYMMHSGFVAAGSSPTANVLRMIPFQIRNLVNIAQLGSRITTLAASGNVQLGVYPAHGNTLLPTGQPLIRTANIPTDTAGLIAAAPVGAASVQLPRGVYWFASIADSAAGATVIMITMGTGSTIFSTLVGASAQATINTSATNGVFARFIATTFGTWPDLTLPTATSEAAGSAAAAAGQFQVAA